MKLFANKPNLITDVLIVGAGPVGSFASNELSASKVSHIIIEKRSQILESHPRAQSVNARSMELFLKHGFGRALREASYLKGDYFPGIILCKNFQEGEESVSFPLDHLNQEASCARSPEKELRVAQWKTDKILRDQIEKSIYADLLLDYQAVEIKDYGSCFLTTVLDKNRNEKITIKSKFLIGADGAHSFVRKEAGITTTTHDVSIPLLNVNFKSKDIHEKIPFDKAYLYYLSGGKAPLATGPIDDEGLWYAQAVSPEKDEYTFEEAANLLKDNFGIDFDCDVYKAYVWHMRANMADQFKQGNLFLIGDAAHCMYATGGLGMNTGFADAQNLAWKIAAYLRGYGTDLLLESYENERKPVALENMHSSSLNLRNALKRSNSSIIEKIPEMQTEGMLKHASNPERELGYYYCHSEVLPFVPEEGYVSEGAYVQRCSPGYFTPHIWLEENTSLYHKLDSQFALIIKKGAQGVAEAQQIASKHNIPLQIIEVEDKKLSGLYSAYTLIRPDWHIVWSGENFSDNFENILLSSLGYKKFHDE